MSFQYAAAVADRGVDAVFDVAKGETVALLGPNGAGKSTVLEVAAGLLAPDRGRVVLDGRVLTSRGEGTPARLVPAYARRVALLAQVPLLFPHLSVLDNVGFGPRSAGASRRASRQQARHWLAEVGIPDLAHRRPGMLSGGQAQRVAVARALAAAPDLLLLDEPLAALDVAVAPALRQTLARVLTDRTTVIVTHDVLDALLLADRVVVLEQGRIVEEGPCAQVLAAPRSAFAARIAGLNTIRGTWRGGGVVAASGLRVQGESAGPPLCDGDPAIAVFSPRSVAIFDSAPGGSPRNAFEATVSGLEPGSGHIRVRAGELSADVTPHAVAALALSPGSRVVFAVKATEVAVYPMARAQG